MGTATLQCPGIALAASCHCPSHHPLSQFRLVVKMALKLLLVFVEYTEPNALLLIHAVNAVDRARGGCRPSCPRGPRWGTAYLLLPLCHLDVSHFSGTCPWSNLMAILEQRHGADTELLVFTMTLINKVQGGGSNATLVGLGVGHTGPINVPLVLLRHWQPSQTRTPSTM